MKGKTEAQVNVPIDDAWNWLGGLENFVEGMPQVKLVEMVNEDKALIEGDIWWLKGMPLEGVAKVSEMDDSEHYMQGLAVGDSFPMIWEASLKCEEVSEELTNITLWVDLRWKGLSGKLFENIAKFTPLTLFWRSEVRKELDGLLFALKDHCLEKWKNQLEEKTKELESFVYTVSHELREPLVSLEGFSDQLQENFADELGEEGRHYLDRIHTNVDKMDRFIDDLLKLSRVGRKEAPKQEVDVKEIINQVTDELSPLIEENEIDIKVGDGFPTLYFEERRLYQIFSNLISNACKYMDKEGECCIEINMNDTSGSWTFWVKDTGVGIEPESLKKVFEIFRQAETATQSSTGVGLSIVKKIVKTHGGKIWVESEVGEGSTFYVKFPKNKVS